MMEHTVKRLRIFGDSILKGVAYDESTDRYVPLGTDGAARYCSPYGVEVQNSAVFGCTVGKGMQLIDRAISKGLACDAALLEFGGNDCDFQWADVAADPDGEHESNTPLEVFKESLREMIRLLRAKRVSPVLMTLPPIDSKRYLAHICRNGLDPERILRWLGSVHNISRRQELYSLQVVSVALDTDVPLIDVRSGFLARRDCEELLCADGIHPNGQGNNLIWSLLAERLVMRKTA